MKTVNWHDGQKLGPADLTCQSMFMNQGLTQLMGSLIGRPSSILELDIDLEYLSSDIFKITHFIGVIFGQVITYPYYNKDSMVYATDQINLKSIEQDKIFIYISLSNKSISKFYHVGKVPFNVPQVRLNTKKTSEQDIILCSLERDETAKWIISPNYIPYSPSYNGIYKQLITQSTTAFMKEVLDYIAEQKRYTLDHSQAFLLHNLEFLLGVIFYQISDSCEQPIILHVFIKDLIKIYKLFESYHIEKTTDEPFYIKSSDPMSLIIKNFKISMRSLMLEGRTDEKINMLPEGDILCAKVDFSNDTKVSHRYYLFIMKPNIDFSYNPKMIRLAAPSRMAMLRNLSIPGIKLLYKSYNPTSINIEKKYYDIFEITSSRELDYVLSEGFIACDQETLPQELRMFLVKNHLDITESNKSLLQK